MRNVSLSTKNMLEKSLGVGDDPQILENPSVSKEMQTSNRIRILVAILERGSFVLGTHEDMFKR